MPTTEQRAAALRAVVNGHVDQVVGDLIREWARLWNEMSADWRKAVDQVIAEGTPGRLTSAQLFRLTRVRFALATSLEALQHLSTETATITVGRVPALVNASATGEIALIAAQLPDAFGGSAALTAAPGRAIEAIVRRSTEQVTSLTRPLAEDAYNVMLAEIQRGVALGVNPNVAARRMLQRAKGGFDGGLSRATRIARTEMLDAHRNAGWAADQANTDVLQGWRWNAHLSPTTCVACLAMNGRVFPVEAKGPEGHVNCRCSRTPVTKSWAELGIHGMVDTSPAPPDARLWFSGLSHREQLAIMGPTRLALLESGEVSWEDLVKRVPNTGWRPSWQPRTLTDLRSAASRTA